MNKKLLVLSMLLIFSLALFCEMKIAVVNSAEVIQKTVKGKAILSELQQIGQEKQKRINALQNEIQSLRADLEKPLNAATKEEKQILLERKQTEYQRFIKDSQREFQRKQQQKMGLFQQQIMPLIKDYCEKEDYTLVLELNVNSPIVHFSESIDITDKIIQLVNEKAK